MYSIDRLTKYSFESDWKTERKRKKKNCIYWVHTQYFISLSGILCFDIYKQTQDEEKKNESTMRDRIERLMLWHIYWLWIIIKCSVFEIRIDTPRTLYANSNSEPISKRCRTENSLKKCMCALLNSSMLWKENWKVKETEQRPKA